MNARFDEDGYEEYPEGENRKIVSLAEKRRGRKQKKRPGVRHIFLCFLVLLAALGILFSPVFAVKNIEMTELAQYTKAELCEKIGLSAGGNLFAFQAGKAKRLLMQDPYIAGVEIHRKLPDTMQVVIRERLVCGYVPYVGGSYLYIDEYGRVLDTQPSFTKPLPVVVGLEFEGFQLGSLLETKNPDSFDVVVQIAHLMTKYEILDMVLRLDVSDPEDVRLYVNQVEIYLGDMKDCDEKIRIMIEAMKHLEEKDRGTLDIRDITRNPIFKYLT